MSILKNYTYNLIYQFLLILLPFITMPYVSRTLGVESLGVFSYTTSISNYFILFSLLGLNNYGNRAIAKVRNNKNELSKTFWNIYSIQLISTLLVILFYLIYVSRLENSMKNIFIIQFIYVFSTLFDINWFFFGIEKFKLTVSRNIFIKLLSIFCIFTFVKGPKDIEIYTLIISCSVLVNQIVLWPYLNKYIFWIKPNLSEIKRHFLPNLALFIPVISVSIYKILDKVMLGYMSNMTQLGFFESAEKISSIQLGVSIALGTVMLPRMSFLLTNNALDSYKKIIRNSMQFIMCISIALCFGLISIADNFIPIFLGVKFTSSIYSLYLLAPTGIIIAWANVIRTQYLIPFNKDYEYVISVIIGAIINVILNLVLIEKFGAVGAAFSTLITEFIVMIFQSLKSSKELDIVIYVKDSLVFLVIGLSMLILIKLISQIFNKGILLLLIQLSFGSIFYITSIYLYFVIFNKTRLYDLTKQFNESRNK